MKKILVINLGSTSTKVAYYEDETRVVKDNLNHPAEEVRAFATLWDQLDYRIAAIEGFLAAHNIAVEQLDAVATRGGHTRPLVGGTYLINDLMLEESRSGQFGTHACDLGLIIARRFAERGPLPLTANSPTTDEFDDVARFSGLPQMPRRSSFHALNHKGVARKFAADVGRPYESLNLIVVHMGGGITVAAHKKGRMVEANNGLLGDGPFSTNRTGALPVGALVEACYSGQYSKQEMMKQLNGDGGMMAYIGEQDLITAEKRAAEGDTLADQVLDAMAYQTAREIGSEAPVLMGEVDAIVITGGMANSQRMTDYIRARVEWIAPVHLYPGEFEMESLALNALEVLNGHQPMLKLGEEG